MQDRMAYVIGGGHPPTDIAPDTAYERELAPGAYRVAIRLMDYSKNYKVTKAFDIFPEVTIGKNESVSLFFQDVSGPEITRSAYKVVERNLGAENRQRMLKKPDWKVRFKAAKQEELDAEESWRSRGGEGYYGGGTIHSNSFPGTYGRYGHGPYGRPRGRY